MSLSIGREARHERVGVGVGSHPRRVEGQLSSPEQTCLLAQINDLLEEALRDANAEPLPDPGQAGVVRQLLVEGIAEVPAVGQVERSGLNQLALGTNPSQTITSWSLKKTTGSMLGRPRSAYISRVQSRTKPRSSFTSS